MEKIERAGTWISIIVGIPIILGWLGWLGGFFSTQNIEKQILVLAIFILLLLLINIFQVRLLWSITNPRKTKLVKRHDNPDTFIYIRGEWRKIPDWQTRDYLAHIFGFRPGEEDIKVVSSQEIDKLKKGSILESIITYSR